MGSPADCAFDFRQSHLNMIRESRWLAPLEENTAEMLAWRSVANCTSGATCAATFFDDSFKATRICNLAAPCSATTKKLCRHRCASRHHRMEVNPNTARSEEGLLAVPSRLHHQNRLTPINSSD